MSADASTYSILVGREGDLLAFLGQRVDVFDHETGSALTELCETVVARAAIERFRAATRREAPGGTGPRGEAPGGTIAGSIMAFLESRPDGACASEVTASLSRWSSTSVRPHLTRLERAGKLWHSDGLWGLAPRREGAGVAGLYG